METLGKSATETREREATEEVGGVVKKFVKKTEEGKTRLGSGG